MKQPNNSQSNHLVRSILFAAMLAILAGPASAGQRQRADAGIAALQNFYNTSIGLFQRPGGWWQSANALETAIDFSARANTTLYTSGIATTFNKNRAGNFLNNYYDDEGWWAVVEFASQSAPPPRVFEVASIKPNPGPWHILHGFSSSGPRLTLEGYTAFDLITEAYSLRNYQVTLAKSLRQSAAYGTYYNIVAKAEGNGTPTKDEFRRMLQMLLVERFDLKFHREMKDMPVYAMVLGKNGPKFKESGPDAALISNHSVNGRNQIMRLSKATLESVAQDIQSTFFVDRPVLDKTGLTGTYDIELEATPEFRINKDPQPGDVSVFTAIQETLGLKLEPQKASVDVLVIDHIEKSTEN